jgi:DHA1 family bicyclomycin/chloramphenicol resistance-like MFS transporter
VIATLGWNAVFVVLTLITLTILLAVVFKMKESKQPDPTFSLRAGPILSSFAHVMKEPQFFTYAMAGGISSAGLFAYLAGSPFVFMKFFGVSEQQYGGIFACIAAGLIGSSQLNNLLLKKFSSEVLMKNILIVQSIIGIILVTASFFNVLGLFGTVFLIFLFLSCQGFSFPNSAALSMAPFTREAGSASALMGALQMGLGSLASASVGLFNASTPVPMTGVMASCTVVGFVILFLGKRRIQYKARMQDVEEQSLDIIEKY